MTDDWRYQATCANLDPELWALGPGPLGAAALTALDTCQACPVRPQCHRDAEQLPRRLRVAVILGGVAYDHNGQPRPERAVNCGQCGATYLAAGPHQRYCGASCRRAAQDRRACARVVARRAEAAA